MYIYVYVYKSDLIIISFRYSADNTYYEGVIENITSEGYSIRYTEYGNKEIRQREHLKLSKGTSSSKRKEEEELLNAEFVIPENLRLKPTDSEVKFLSYLMIIK